MSGEEVPEDAAAAAAVGTLQQTLVLHWLEGDCESLEEEEARPADRLAF